MRRKVITGILVSAVMIAGLLAITNPDRKNYRMFDYVEGRLEHDDVFFSIYQQSGYTLSGDGRYKVYKRYLGIATQFFEISPLRVPVDN